MLIGGSWPAWMMWCGLDGSHTTTSTATETEPVAMRKRVGGLSSADWIERESQRTPLPATSAKGRTGTNQKERSPTVPNQKLALRKNLTNPPVLLGFLLRGWQVRVQS